MPVIFRMLYLPYIDIYGVWVVFLGVYLHEMFLRRLKFTFIFFIAGILSYIFTLLFAVTISAYE